MKKIKLLGVSKFEKYNNYTFQKNQDVLALIRKLLKELSCSSYHWNAFGRPLDKKCGEPVYDKEENINGYTDKRFAFEGDECHIEIVFGKGRVFVTVYTERNMQQRLAEFVGKFTRM